MMRKNECNKLLVQENSYTKNGTIMRFLSWSRFIQNEWHNSLFDNFTPVKDLITKHSGDYEGIVVMSPAKKVSSVVKVLPLLTCSGCSSLYSFPSQKQKNKNCHWAVRCNIRPIYGPINGPLTPKYVLATLRT